MGRQRICLTPNTGDGHEITLGEEEISDVTLATFYVFDKENAGTSGPTYNLPEAATAATGVTATAATAAAATTAAEAVGAATAAEAVTGATAAEVAGVGIRSGWDRLRRLRRLRRRRLLVLAKRCTGLVLLQLLDRMAQ